jgi:hypothetical protein
VLSLHDHYPIPPFIPRLTNEELRRLNPPKECPTCKDRGTFFWDHDENGLVKKPVEWECSCLDQKILSYYLQRCGLNRQLFWRGLDELPYFEGRDAEQLVEYLSRPDEYARAGISLILSGNPFNGKSTWATALLKLLIDRRWDVQCMNLDALADTYVATWGSKTKDAKQQQAAQEYFTDRVINVPMLLIDNIGRNTQRADVSSVQQAFLRVTHDRAEAGNATIFTFCQNLKTDKPYVPTDHLEATTLSLIVDGPDLQSANKKRLFKDMNGNITRPVRLK